MNKRKSRKKSKIKILKNNNQKKYIVLINEKSEEPKKETFKERIKVDTKPITKEVSSNEKLLKQIEERKIAEMAVENRKEQYRKVLDKVIERQENEKNIARKDNNDDFVR